MPKMVSFGEKPLEAEVGPAPVGKKRKIWYDSISIPAEAFDKTPTVGSKYRMNAICEVVEVRKTEGRGTQIRVEVQKGRVLSSAGKVNMEEFAKMNSKQRAEYQEKDIEEA